MAYQEAKDKTFIRITSEFTASGIQMNILVYKNTLPNSGIFDRAHGLLVRNAKKLNEFLDKYIDAEPVDGFEVINQPAGAVTRRFIREIREYQEVRK